MSDERREPSAGDPEAPPPVLGSWRNVYAAVLGLLAVSALLLWVLTQAYA